VHLWLASLDTPGWPLTHLVEVLSPDERARAARFHFPIHSRRFVAARGQLRRLLGAYLQIPASRLLFEYNGFGKPYLAAGCNPQRISFNLSHSRSRAVFAFTIGREIGVDIEYIRRDYRYEEFWHSVFTSRERHAIQLAHPHERCREFFTCWTHKEAYIKARGEGLSMALTEFEVVTPAMRYCLDAPWSFVIVPPLDDYAVALALEGACHRLQSFVLQDALELAAEPMALASER
jgi:4'-phosphopantetheinyl transferase